jgi:hypothetical protein
MSEEFDGLLRYRLARLAAAVPDPLTEASGSLGPLTVRARPMSGSIGMAALAAVVLLAAVIGLRPTFSPPAASSSPAGSSSITAQVVVPDFVLSITVPKATWTTDEIIAATASLRYTGTSSRSATVSGNGFFAFGVSDSTGSRQVDPIWEDSCALEALTPGQVWTRSFYKTGAAYDAFALQFLHEPQFRLPAGSWLVTVYVDVGMSGCGTDVRNFSASVPIDVVDASTTETSVSPTAATATFPSTTTQPSREASPPVPSAPPCDPSQATLSPGGWGGAGGTMFAVIHVHLTSGPPCLMPAYPGVELVDAAGRVIASGPSRDESTVLVTDAIDLRLAWASWCAAPPPGPLRARLQIGAGQLEVSLPAGLVAPPCQGVPTSVYVEPVKPIGT